MMYIFIYILNAGHGYYQRLQKSCKIMKWVLINVRSVVQCLAGNLNFEDMTSYLPSRSSAYSSDLRWMIIVHQREMLGCSYEEVSKNLGVDISTVERTMNLLNTTDRVDKKIYPKDKSFRKLTIPAHLLMLLKGHMFI